MGRLERKPFLGTPGSICKREQPALLLYAEGEISLSRCHMRFRSKENLPPLGVAAAFVGTLARRGGSVAACPGSPPSWGSWHVRCLKSPLNTWHICISCYLNYFLNSGANIFIVLLFVALERNITTFIFSSLYFYRFWQDSRLLNDFIINICIIAT